MKTTIDRFTQGYLDCALWSSTDDDGASLDAYSIDDIAPETLAQMLTDCAEFQKDYWTLIESNVERAGHDFWLTRNRHGAGFWDGDWEHSVGKRLTDASHAYGSYDLYVGDDGRIYGN